MIFGFCEKWGENRGGGGESELGRAVSVPPHPNPPAPPLGGAVAGDNLLAQSCMLLYWQRQAEPIFCFTVRESGPHSGPVP